MLSLSVSIVSLLFSIIQNYLTNYQKNSNINVNHLPLLPIENWNHKIYWLIMDDIHGKSDLMNLYNYVYTELLKGLPFVACQ